MDMLAWIVAAVFALLGLLHFYWALAGVGELLLATVAIVVMRLDLLIAGAAAVMILRAIGDFRLVGFFKRVRDSRFARMDTLVYSPLCLALGAGLAALAAS